MAKATNAKSKKEAQGVFKSADDASRVVTPIVQDVFRLARHRGDIMPVWAGDNLFRWMERLEQGSKVDSRTPLFDKASRQAIVGHFDSRARAAEKTFWGKQDVPGFARSFYMVENEQKEKIGPMSIWKPWTLDGPEKTDKIYRNKRVSDHLNWKAWEQSLDYISKLLPAGGVHPITLNEALHGMGGNPETALDTSTNSCYSTWVKRWYDPSALKRHEEKHVLAFELIMSHAKRLLSDCASAATYRETPIIQIATVSQRTNVMKGPKPLDNPKLKRPVIAQPKDVNTLPGKTVMSPIQKALKRVANPETGVPIILGWQPQGQIDKGVNLLLEYQSYSGGNHKGKSIKE